MSASELRTSPRTVALIVVAALAFATSGPFGKMTAHEVPASAVAAFRTGLPAIVLALVDWRGFVTSLRRLSRRQRIGVVVAGALLAAHLALFLAGLARTSLAAAVALVSLEPLAVVLAAFIAFRLRPTRLEMIGLLVATAGAVVVAMGAGEGEHRIEGDLLVLGAVVCFGAYVASARGLRDALPATPYAAAVYGAAAIALLPLALPPLLRDGSGAAATHLPSLRAAGAMIGLALVPTLIGHTIVQRAARHAPPALVALVCPGETVGSIAIGALFMGASPSLREGIGAAIVLLGATVAILGQRPPR